MIRLSFSTQSKRTKQLTGSLVVLIVAIVGTITLVISHAATPAAAISVAVGSGTVTSPASVITDSTAIGGKAVEFGSVGTSTGGTGSTLTAVTKGVGFAIPLPSMSVAAQKSALQDLQSLGVTWLRFDISWANVQPNNASTYNWSEYDSAIALANSYGMHIDAIIDYDTPWAAQAGCSSSGSVCQPANVQTYATFAAAVAQRYGSKVAAEEIWNEPNNAQFWQPAPNPAYYVSMLKAAYTAIKAVDPNMIVVSGGLAPETDDGSDISMLTFTQDMYNDGAKGYFDAFGDHPYSYPAIPSEYFAWSGWSQMNQTNPSIRSIMTANGQASVPIWMTEVGAPTGGPGTQETCTSGTNFQGSQFTDDQCLQAENTSQAVEDEESSAWAGPVFIYSYQDLGTDQSTVENFFGILTYDGSQKQSYSALKQAIAAGK